MPRKFILMQPVPRGVFALAQALCLCVTLGLQGASYAQQGGGRSIALPTQPAQPQPTQTGANNGTTTTRPELVLQTGYPFGGANGLNYSPDGKLLATTTFNSNQVKLWDVATGRELRTLAIGGGSGGGLLGGALTGVSAVAFSRDSHLLAAGGRDNAITVWDTSNGHKLHTLMPGMENASLLGVIALVFSADAHELVAFSDAVRAWDMTSGQVLRQTPLDLASLQNFALSGSLTGGGGVARSADGSQLALLTGDARQKRTVKLYDIASGRDVRSVNVPDDFADCQQTTLALTPDARVLGACAVAEGSGDNTKLKLWDLSARGKPRVLAEGNRAYGGQLGFSPGGRWLAQSVAQTVKVYDVATGAERQTFTVDKLPGQTDLQGFFATFAFSADEKFLAVSGFNGAINLREIESGRTTQTLVGHSNFAVGVAFSADGTRLISGARTIWDLTTGRGVRTVRDADPFGVMSRDGRLLAAITIGDSPVTLYDTNTQRRLFTLLPADAAGPPSLKVTQATTRRGAKYAVQQPAFSPDGRLLATSYNEIGDISDNSEPDEPPQIDKKAAEKAQKELLKNMSKNPAAAMQVYNDAIAKASGGRSATLANQIKLWDTQTGREARTISVPGSNPYLPTSIKDARFSPDGRALAVLTHNSPTVTLWDVQTGAQIGVVGAPPAPSNANPYGLPNMTSSPGGRGAVMQMPDLSQIPGMGAMSGGTQVEASTVAFSADGRLVALGGKESKSGFDMAAMMAQMSGALRDPKAARVNPDALQQQMLKQLQQTTLAGTLKLYDAATGRELNSFTGHTTEVKVIAFSPDGRLLASAAGDNTIKLWDVNAGRELQTLTGHTAEINSLAFNPDSTLLASASNDGSTLLWDVRQGRQLATLVSLYDGDEWLVATPDGFFDGSPKAWNQVLWRYDENTFNVAPIEWFFNEFFYPGLLADLVGGKRPRAAQNFADKDRRQPQVAVSLVDANAGSTPIATRNVKLKIDVRDALPDATHKTSSGARDLRLFRNGSLVKVWHGDVLQGQPSAALELTLPLVAGANRLTAYAFNRDNVKSRDANLAVTGADTLKRAGTAYVLSIGINEYANTQYNLRYAVADAREFGAEIERQQTKLGGYAHVQVVTLLDREATKANIMAALMKLAAETQPEDEVIVYFAGHGTAQANQFYLIPHDLGHMGSRTKLTAAALQSILAHSVSDAELEAAFEGVNAAQLMFVIDACNSGQALDSEEKRRGPMNSKGLAQLAYEKGMYILTAAQSFQAAQEAAQVGHGLLTYALIEEGLKQAMSDKEPKDGAVLAREWFNYAEQRVPAMQVEKMKQTRALSFVEDDGRGLDIQKRVAQHPRFFYRRELEAQPLIVARP